MRIAMLSPIAWRTPPRKYGPWELVTSLITEGLVKKGIDVTLFATADSVTGGKLHAVVPRPYEEDRSLDAKVCECLHISELFERAESFDLIHNNFDFLPLTYSKLTKTPVLTTIHGFSSPKILPVYKKYNDTNFYVSISNANRSPELNYIDTVYHGINMENFTYQKTPEDYLLFLGRIHHDKGASEAIQIARKAGKKLIMAGIIQDESYFKEQVEPFIDGTQVKFVGAVGPEMRDELLGKALGFIHSINFNEPFGLSVVEANACGTPVVAFNKGSMPEIISDGENGFLVNDVSSAADAISNLKTISRQRCRAIVEERFSQDKMVEKYLAVYRQIIGKND
ncbi:MAG: glycosyltransferase family 4 protein [Thermoplasmata archaeon]|nr:glycosyltransferase family 4 protein [Thermoplasmata archaeon]